jgi:phage baseplate assembly protein W
VAEYDVTVDLKQIDFGATGAAEILQNVRMIIATPEYSCPLDRAFAWNPDILDAPINVAQGRITARLVAALRKYEPRAQVVKVSFQGDGLSGVLKPAVKVRIADDAV